MLEGGALLTDDFVEFSRDFVLFCHVNSQVPTDKHQTLMEEIGGQFWPYFAVLDADGSLLQAHEGPPTVEGFAKTGARARHFSEVRRKAREGDRLALAELFLVRLEMGQMTSGEAEQGLAGLSAEQRTRAAPHLATLAVREILRRTPDGDGAARSEAGRRFLEMHRQGRPPPAGGEEFQGYCVLLLEQAEAGRDVAVFEAVLKSVRERFGDAPGARDFIRDREAALEKLKSGGK